MNVFIQGMRRSGTTILYDALLEDPDMRCFYEPLREEKVSEGGGSGAREGDAFAEMSALRDGFRRAHYPGLTLDDFNWGGPRAPGVELEPHLPEHCRELLRHLLTLAPQVAIKETRLYCKVDELADLDPGAVLVHVVRDPRAVAASIVLGRGRRRLQKLGGPDGFFADRKPRRLWSSREISERLFAADDHGPDDPSNVERVLAVWAHTFLCVRRRAPERFGDRYLILRNEDLRADPGGSLGVLYGRLDRPVPEAVAVWAAANVRAPQPPYAADDPRWQEALGRAGASAAAVAAGYPEAAAAGDTLTP